MHYETGPALIWRDKDDVEYRGREYRGTDKPSHTKKGGVKDDYFSLEALAKDMLSYRGLQFVSRPFIFELIDLYEVPSC